MSHDGLRISTCHKLEGAWGLGFVGVIVLCLASALQMVVNTVVFTKSLQVPCNGAALLSQYARLAITPVSLNVLELKACACLIIPDTDTRSRILHSSEPHRCPPRPERHCQDLPGDCNLAGRVLKGSAVAQLWCFVAFESI